MATNNLSVSGTASWIGAALGTTYRAITMLLVRAGTNARLHFRTGLSAAGSGNSGYALQCVDDDNSSPANVDLHLMYRNLYAHNDIRIKNGFNIQTTADDASWSEGSSGQVLTSGGSGASMSWAAAGGKVLQVFTVSEAGDETTTSTSYVTVGTCSQALTCAATANKVLLIFMGTGRISSAVGHVTFYADSTDLGPVSGDGFSKTELTNNEWANISLMHLHAPSSTSAITYTVKYKMSASGTFYLPEDCQGTFIVAEVEG
jgi:hypothetical protein